MIKTAIVGISPNRSRFAYRAAELLSHYNHPMILLGIRPGTVEGVKIEDIRSKPVHEDIHTLTLYIAPRHQPEHYNYLLSLKPQRVIFNPGSENAGFRALWVQEGVEVIEACTLVMLNTGQF